MKKISFVVAMLLACVVAFTSCNLNSDPCLTEADLKDTEWLLGTWESTISCDGYIESETIEIIRDVGNGEENKQNVEKVKENLLAMVKSVGVKETNVDGSYRLVKEIRLSKRKDVITIIKEGKDKELEKPYTIITTYKKQ